MRKIAKSCNLFLQRSFEYAKRMGDGLCLTQFKDFLSFTRRGGFAVWQNNPYSSGVMHTKGLLPAVAGNWWLRRNGKRYLDSLLRVKPNPALLLKPKNRKATSC